MTDSVARKATAGRKEYAHAFLMNENLQIGSIALQVADKHKPHIVADKHSLVRSHIIVAGFALKNALARTARLTVLAGTTKNELNVPLSFTRLG
jgi:hypothetical protein